MCPVSEGGRSDSGPVSSCKLPARGVCVCSRDVPGCPSIPGALDPKSLGSGMVPDLGCMGSPVWKPGLVCTPGLITGSTVFIHRSDLVLF